MPLKIDTCIIVSFYDARSPDHLIALLRQLRETTNEGDVVLHVVVNSVTGRLPILPNDLIDTSILMRQNAGFNIGAWDHGWRQNPGFSYYVFLQDECSINRADWLGHYKRLLQGPVGVVGESLLYWSTWIHFRQRWPEAMEACLALARVRGTELGATPTHLQTLVLATSASCLSATDGFPSADEKVQAIATEIIFSRLCINLGFKIKQSAWRPFEYIRHPQWDSVREESAQLKWNISRIQKNFLRFLKRLE